MKWSFVGDPSPMHEKMECTEHCSSQVEQSRIQGLNLSNIS